MFGIVKSEIQNYWTVLVLDLLLKKYFVHGLDHDLKLLFVPVMGKSKRNLTPPPAPKKRNCYFDHGSVFEERRNASVGSRC